MRFFRWLSLGLAGCSALLMAGWTALLIAPAWVTDTGYYGLLIVSAGAGALVIGVIHRVVSNAYESEHRKLTAYIESLRDEENVRDAPQFRFGLNELAEVARDTFQPMRQRLATLSQQRRDLEVQARVAEAERRHLEAILNAITDAVLVTDAFNEVVLANEAAARLLSFDLKASRRRPVDQVLHDPTLVKLIKDTRAGGRASLHRNVEHRIGHNGQTAVYEVTLACVAAGANRVNATSLTNVAQNVAQVTHQANAGHGNRARSVATVAAPEPSRSEQAAAGVVTILRDVTREKEIQEMKSDFVSNVSHELRTPLSSIKAYMEMLVDGEAQDDQTRAEFYNIIQGETNRLSRLIDNILNISRIESGIIKVQREQISLPQLAREAVEVMLPQARAKRIELVLKPTPVYFQVFADRDMIHQSLLNYIGNAIKYTPEGGQVTVELRVDEPDQMVIVAVSDTGVGVPEGDLPHLFDKFYRVSDHKKLAKGTGLGLNLVKHVIETVHGGRVGAISNAGHTGNGTDRGTDNWTGADIGAGSTFTFALPIAENIDGDRA